MSVMNELVSTPLITYYSAENVAKFVYIVLRLVELAMHFAVSILSPVSIHILIPALLNESIQSDMLF